MFSPFIHPPSILTLTLLCKSLYHLSPTSINTMVYKPQNLYKYPPFGIIANKFSVRDQMASGHFDKPNPNPLPSSQFIWPLGKLPLIKGVSQMTWFCLYPLHLQKKITPNTHFVLLSKVLGLSYCAYENLTKPLYP